MNSNQPFVLHKKRVLLTGGAGFIGVNLVTHLLASGYHVVNLDKLTYAGNLISLSDIENHSNYNFIQADIANGSALRNVFAQYCPAAVIHLAAESHVDRSIDAPAVFVETNIVGTFQLLQESRRYFDALSAVDRRQFRFVHCSTDEVYGSLGPEDASFTTASRYDPHSPYSASKAAADHLVRAWHTTYGLPTIVTHSANNYGPYQYPEKLIPVAITQALAGEPIPVFGSGQQVRDWIHVSDHCEALALVLESGRVGESYNIGANCELPNLQLIKKICSLLDELKPRSDGRTYAHQITQVADRPGHDFRYSIDASKLRIELGWQPKRDFGQGLRETVIWYMDNLAWCDALRSRRHGIPEDSENRAQVQPEGHLT